MELPLLGPTKTPPLPNKGSPGFSTCSGFKQGRGGMKVRILEPSYKPRRKNPNAFLKNLKGTRTNYTKQRRYKKETMSHTHEGFGKSGSNMESLITGGEILSRQRLALGKGPTFLEDCASCGPRSSSAPDPGLEEVPSPPSQPQGPGSGRGAAPSGFRLLRA